MLAESLIALARLEKKVNRSDCALQHTEEAIELLNRHKPIPQLPRYYHDEIAAARQLLKDLNVSVTF